MDKQQPARISIQQSEPPSHYFLRSAKPFDKGCALQLELEAEIVNLLENDGGPYSKCYDAIETVKARNAIAKILGLKKQ